MDTTIGVCVSIIAVIISIASYINSKAINNQIQLQNNYMELCQKLQKIIDFGSEHSLISFKYDIENYTFLDKNSIESHMEFNNLQKKFSEQKMQLKSVYAELSENLDFLHLDVIFPRLSKENQLDSWLSDNINAYFLKLDRYYNDLYEISVLVTAAQKGLFNTNEKQVVSDFFDNIADIIKTSQALQFLKRAMAGRFKMLSVREVNIFNNNEVLISKIKNEMYSFVMKCGIDDAIKDSDFSKIKKIAPDFGDGYDSFISEHKSDYLAFLSNLRRNSNKNT